MSILWQWHELIPEQASKYSGIIIDAMQRYLQFDTFGGVIPAKAIDLLYTKEELTLLTEKACSFYLKHLATLEKFPQNRREEAVRAHLCGIINLPIPSEDNWHDAFAKLHAKNRKIYDELSTAGRVEQLLDRHLEADTIATAVSKYQADHAPEYTPAELIAWTTDATRFYHENRERITRHSQKEQRIIISQFLAGKSDFAW